MKYSIRLSYLFIVMLIWSVQVSAQRSLPVQQDYPQVFQLAQAAPALNNGASNNWNGKWLNSGAMVYHDGLFHMFPNGFHTWPGPVTIGYATSEDGINFTYHDDIVLESADVSYAGILVMSSSVHVEDDGTWVLYFYNWTVRSAPFGMGGIGRATAPAPGGPWTADSDLVLSPGTFGAWDGRQLSVPLVLKTDDGYVMYYSGFSQDRKMAIGMATSTDGIEWTKYNDPQTTETRYAESDPVMRPDVDAQDWEHPDGVERPRVVITENGYVMLYRSGIVFGLATSDDGIHWTRHPENPLIVGQMIPNGSSLWFPSLLYVDGTLYAYVEAITRGSSSQVYVFTHDGTIISED